MAIVKSSLRFTTVVHWSIMFSLKKALLPWNFKCQWDKRLVACWRSVLKFWLPTPNFWLHWRPVSHNFGPWYRWCQFWSKVMTSKVEQRATLINVLRSNHQTFDQLAFRRSRLCLKFWNSYTLSIIGMYNVVVITKLNRCYLFLLTFPTKRTVFVISPSPTYSRLMILPVCLSTTRMISKKGQLLTFSFISGHI